ncbi:MAG: 4Fe-4S binding protein [Bacteroidetes bacterium]|nr:4Fe-4S binding protein [Bacteroidota bacterium]
MKIKRQISNKTLLRISTQFGFLLLFFALFLFGLEGVKFFFYTDPLILVTNLISTGEITLLFLLAIIPLTLTFLFGRFFCGWVCPFGAINQFFSWLFRKSNKSKTNLKRNLLSVKYFILPGVVAASLLGVQIWNWLEPYSLLTRSMVTLFPAGLILNNTILPILDSGRELTGEKLMLFPYFISGLFFFLLFMNFYMKRFFCNVLCPLGALYGLISRFSLINLSTAPSCNDCLQCGRNCTYYGNPSDEYLKSECLLCYNCENNCPSGSVETSFDKKIKKEVKPLDIGRRKAIGSIFAGIATAAIIKSEAKGKGKKRSDFIRPPGALEEENFLERCVRCGQCVQSCPTGFIQSANLENGIENLWTPVLSAATGYCQFECNKCTPVCPTGALQKLTLQEKKTYKLGTAIINKNLCFTYAEGFTCTVCYDKCPLKDKAIKQRETDVWNYMGKEMRVKQIYIDTDYCNGCGLCEYVCPRTDEAAIVVTSESEFRRTSNLLL